MCLFESTRQTLVIEVFIALKDNFTNTNSLLFIDIKGYIYRLLNNAVWLHLDINLTIEKTLLGKMLFEKFDVFIYDMIREFVASFKF